MTLFYPDLSDHQHGIAVTGAYAVCEKATEGHTYTSPDYARVKAACANLGIFFWAYHFLREGDGAGQAQHAFSVVGKDTGLMVDVEPTTGSNPTLADEIAFVDAYRKLGGTVWFDYLPHWYWSKPVKDGGLGSPSMQALIDRKLLLVSSDYGVRYSDSDTARGWLPYGGRKPVVWQYTASHLFNGWHVDFNAYRHDPATSDTALAQFRSLVLTGKLPVPAGVQLIHADGKTSLRQYCDRLAVTVQSAIWQTAQHRPGGFGVLEAPYISHGDWDAKLPAGTAIWAGKDTP